MQKQQMIVNFILLLILSITSQNLAAKTDLKSIKDHPVISKYAKSHLIGYALSEYDEYSLATASKQADGTLPHKMVEGKISTYIYETDTTTDSVLRIYRNFEKAFKKAGFKKIHECKMKQECGKGFIISLLDTPSRSANYNPFDIWNAGESNYRYWSGIVEKNNKQLYVSLIISAKTFGKFPIQIVLDVIEPEEMDTDLVEINLDSLTDSMNANGKVVLDGIYFDNDKATMKKESAKTLKVIAQYLKNNINTQVYLVGHTDNNGSDQYNKNLSRQRSKAVADALNKYFKINKNRFDIYGIGAISPVTTNETEQGRAQNRRVEMVLKKS